MSNETISIKVKSKPVIRNRIDTLRMLENLEMQTIEEEKDARMAFTECKPSKLFNLVAKASFYRAATGVAEELYPNDPDIVQHVKSSKNLLVDKALTLVSRFEEECECKLK